MILIMVSSDIMIIVISFFFVEFASMNIFKTIYIQRKT